MHKALLAKQNFKIITGPWPNQQLLKLSANLKNSCNGLRFHSFKNVIMIPAARYTKTLSHIRTLCTQRSYSNNTQQFEKYEPLDVKYETSLNVTVDKDELVAHNFNYKQLLYMEEDDIMKKLNSTEDFSEIRNILEEEKSNLHKQHIVQALILQWMFNRHKYFVNQPIEVEEQNFIQYILSLLKDNVPKLNINELSTCYLYLRKMGIENSDPVLEEILINALDETRNAKDIIDLSALSRLVVGINIGDDFCVPTLCANFMGHLKYHIDTCQNEEDARKIAICLYNLQTFANDEIMDTYKKKVSNLVSSKKISSSTPKTIIKILNLLNMTIWSHQHVSLIRDLLLSLEACIKHLNANDLRNISRMYLYHMEPVSIHDSLADALQKLLSTETIPETLAFYARFAKPEQREALVSTCKHLISSSECCLSPNSSIYIFSALRDLKISDTKICNIYWSGVTQMLNEIPQEQVNLRFLRHCHRYMNFNNNLGGTYRHRELERKLSQMCMKAIEHDLEGRIPQKFARLASFVLAYGHTSYSWKKYPNILLSKIINMSEQFTPTDCYVISRGLRISLEMRYRVQTPSLVSMQLATIDSVLSSCVEKSLGDEHLTVTDLNMLVRTLINRKTLKNSVIYHKTLQKYKEIKCRNLNSRIIKDMTYNFTSTNYLVPEILDNMFSYIEKNHEYVGGDVVEKILTCTYNLGYTPKSDNGLLYAGEILLRDFNYMSGLALVHSCLALCFYKAIQQELIDKVFCVKFIQRVEEEIQMCYSKATYPERVLNIVMQLNRSVCLEFPEANVPWFQQSFIEAQISKKPSIESQFSRDVKSLLTAILKRESYIRCNHITPYGYQIDFLINFDKNKNPIKAPVETTMLDRITKVAILLLKLDSFCENDLNALKGPDSVKIKHLEMMGYKVLHINEHDWNSKYMNVSGAKQNYLKCLLKITNSTA